MLAAVRGVDPRQDEWAWPLWPLLEVVDVSADEPWRAVLAEHLVRASGLRFAEASHLIEGSRSNDR